MDGIPSGISSVTPNLPETATSPDKYVAHGPPVEILPLPDDSFQGATAELLNNPFTLDMNLKGRGDELSGGRLAAKTSAPPTGSGSADGAAGAQLGEAYTLSLGYGEDAPVPPEMARELSRMRNYEQLGRSVRPSYRRNPDTGALEQNTIVRDENESAAFLSDRMRGLMAQSAAEQGAGDPLAGASGAADSTEPAVRETPARSVGNQTVSLTLSDYEAILSLEPELQEALRRMLGGEDIILGPPGQSEETGTPAQKAAGAPASGRPLDASDSAAPQAAAAAALGGAEAGMVNLRKISELPYALYLFGNAGIEKRSPAEEDGAPLPVEWMSEESSRTTEFLRLPEAVKMASVLHSIYHGGSGYFPQESPWYAPYLRYAVRYGIVRSGEFGDWSEFATRAQTAYIFSGCVPKAEFPIINYTPCLLDVDEDAGYGAHIYLLCRAGVLLAGDSGRFYPDSMITRTEAAGVIGRIATPSDRKTL
jgi:hypothetical protein